MRDYKKRWHVLAMYSTAAGLSQFLWLNFAPLISLMKRTYGVSENTAGLLLLVFPLIYVVMSVPAGSLIDRRGYRFGIGLGLAIMSAFACLRIVTDSFWVLLVAQIGIAIGQPYVVNGISKLVLDWFDPKEEAIATGIGTAGLLAGMALGLAVSSPIVTAVGLRATMAIFAGVSILVSLGFYVIVHPNAARKAELVTDSSSRIGEHLLTFLGERDLVLIFLLAFLGLGFFNGLTTWIEPILAPRGIDSDKAGMVGGVLILGGILGAAVIPAFSDHFRRRKPFLIGSIVAALATIYPLCDTGNYHRLLLLGALQGFFFLPAYSIMLQMSAELVGATRAGAATAILMLTGNVGGVIVIMAMQWVKSDRTGFAPAVNLLAGLLVVGVVLAVALRETHPSRTQPAPA